MKIFPGIGIGEVRYGMSEKQLIDMLGVPERVDESEYVEGSDDWNRELWYTSRNLTFTFDKEDDFRLGTITIMGSGYTLFNKQLFGQNLNFLTKTISRETGEIAKYEDCSSEELPEHECLIHDALGIMFWFDYKELTQMQCSYLFESDNETVIWPK